MPVFEYKALNKKGRQTSGIVDAEGVYAARQKLRGKGVFPVSVRQVRRAHKEKETDRSFRFSFLMTRVRPYEIALATRQLSTLLGAGLPLVSAMESLSSQTRSHGLQKVMAQIKDAVVEGSSFGGALSLFPGIFSPLYINMVHAGESSGTLDIVLDRLADITEKQQALKNKMQSALVYPIFMFFIGAVILFFLLTYVVPSITGIFTDMNQVLPAPTRFLIHLSGILKSYWWIMLGCLILCITAFHIIRKTEKGRFASDKIFLHTPIFGPILKKLSVARFTRTLGSLIENGVSLLTSLDIVKNIAGNKLIENAVKDAAVAVGKGQGLGQSLAESQAMPYLSIEMIQVGEQSGNLESMLEKIADIYETDVEAAVLRLTALLEPVMILIMGVVIGFIVLSICLPIFEMSRLIK
jgi:general secretion pathway protein F